MNAPRHVQERRDADPSAPEHAWEHTFDWRAQSQQHVYLLFAKREQKRGDARPCLSSTDELIERDEE